MEVVLASTSPYRRAQLEQLGVPFRCVAPQVDEDAFKVRISDPLQLATQLARAKAEAVAANEPDAVVVGGDQLVAFNGRVLGKPGDAAGAIRQLSELSGNCHQLITCVSVTRGGRDVAIASIAAMTMRHLTLAEIERYVAADEPFDCAGSYKWERRGVALFSKIETDDPTGIVGLPLMRLAEALRSFGIEVP